MTSARAIRGTKVKIFLYVSGVLIITGLMACYNNTLSQLEDIRKTNDVCQQQQENLSTQLQVLTDYKLKLETSLKSEKVEHQQSKKDLEVKISEAKTKGEKASNDALLKYNSLQQHYSLLKTEHDDFKEESARVQQKQLEEINRLHVKLKEVGEELQKLQSSKENLKTQFTELEIETQKLRSVSGNATDQSAAVDLWKSKYSQLAEKYENVKTQCNTRDSIQALAEQLDNSKNILPVPQNIAPASSSTKSGPKLLVNNRVKPLLFPSVTPESAKKPVNLKVPQGLVPALPRENQNEQPETKLKKEGKDDNLENDNGAREVFDVPFQDPNSPNVKYGNNLAKIDVGNEKDKKVEAEYKDLQHEEDDDPDYPNPALDEGLAVRN